MDNFIETELIDKVVSSFKWKFAGKGSRSPVVDYIYEENESVIRKANNPILAHLVGPGMACPAADLP